MASDAPDPSVLHPERTMDLVMGARSRGDTVVGHDV